MTSALHPPLAECDPVPLFEAAYAKATLQSTMRKEPKSSWMFSTEEEEEPFWQIDLGAIRYLKSLRIWLAPVPRDTEVTVVAYAIPTPAGDPPRESARWQWSAGDLPVATEGSSVVDLAADTVARFVRVSLRRPKGGHVALLARGAEIRAASLFAETLYGSYARAFTLFADRPLFASRRKPGEGRFFITHHYRDAWTQAQGLAAALAGALESETRDERIFLGLCARNRPEWVIGDLAAVMRGYVVVPLSPDDSDDRLALILQRCPVHALVLDGGADLAARITRLSASCPSLRLVVLCDGEAPQIAKGPAIARFADLVARGAAIDPPPAKPRSARDLHTLLFTSGSSGTPKGAMRSYATFLAMLSTYGVAQPAVHLSFQPLSHLSERMYLPSVLLQGGLIGFSSGGAHLLSDLRELEPSMVGSVPRLFELVHAAHRRRLAAALAASPSEPAERVEERVLAESRLAFGRRIQGIGIGSAPVSPEVLAFLHRAFAGAWVADGYGSTECGTITLGGRVRADVAVKLVPVPGVAEGPDRG
jgi:hypothetical protein